ncbi:MAG: hypothetical protein ACD_37C00491G0001, partial [uncultured bacterium]
KVAPTTKAPAAAIEAALSKILEFIIFFTSPLHPPKIALWGVFE